MPRWSRYSRASLGPSQAHAPLAVTLLAIAACGGDDVTQPPGGSPPRVASASATANPNSALSASIKFTAENADSARVIYVTDQSIDSTPYSRVTNGAGTIVTLGLQPTTGYRNVVQVVGPGGVARSDTVTFTSGPLPDLLQRVSITTTGTAGPGLTITSMQVGGNSVFALAFDSAGAIRWYRRFDGTETIGGELKQQHNGNFTMYSGTSFGSQKVPGRYVEFTPAGDSVRAFTVSPPAYVDDHELWITTGSDGQERIHFFTYTHRTTDLTSIGGIPNAELAGHQVVRLRPDGTTEFTWDAWDHLALGEWIEPPKPGPVDPLQPDFDHLNSIDFDADGNYIVSIRNFGQVVNIDAQTGAIRWRLGGVKNEFSFVNDPLNGFSAQHSARMLPNGHLLLYDNGTRHQPPESRAVEYALDVNAKTATLVWQFRHAPIIYTPFVGLVQRLTNGNTLIGYGFAAHATEATPNQTVAWEADLKLDGKPAFVYRLVRIASLYRYQAP